MTNSSAGGVPRFFQGTAVEITINQHVHRLPDIALIFAG